MFVTNEMLAVFQNKKTLFLENDHGLYHNDGTLEMFLIDNKCKYNVLYDLSSLNVDYIINQISKYDIIAFQTSWQSDISRKLRELLYTFKFNSNKIIVDCVSGTNPQWYYKPKSLNPGNDHTFYNFYASEHRSILPEDIEDWEFDKLM